MDAPPIQYARTADGVNIAYWRVGRGYPLLHLEAIGDFAGRSAFAFPPIARRLESLAERFDLVGLHARNTGDSDHGIQRLALDDFVEDLRAVADAVALSQFALHAHSWATPVAIRFAARYPQRVSHLVLDQPLLRGSDGQTSMRTGLVHIAQADPEAAVSAIATALGVDEPGEREALATWLKTVMENPDRDALVKARGAFDVTADIASIATPTLLLRDSGGTFDTDSTREIAAALPDARVVTQPGATAPPGEAIAQFVGRTGAATESRRAAGASGLRILLFTDLESSTELTRSLGDEKAQEILRGHNDSVRAALAANDGEEVKHTGDGIFAAFGSAVSAVEAALQIQRDLAGGEVRVRIGLNAGEPIQEDDDYFGTAVQLAARVCDRAEPGQVLVSNVVKELCSGKLFQFADQGEATLKGFPDPVRLFVVGAGD